MADPEELVKWEVESGYERIGGKVAEEFGRFTLEVDAMNKVSYREDVRYIV